MSNISCRRCIRIIACSLRALVFYFHATPFDEILPTTTGCPKKLFFWIQDFNCPQKRFFSDPGFQLIQGVLFLGHWAIKLFLCPLWTSTGGLKKFAFFFRAEKWNAIIMSCFMFNLAMQCYTTYKSLLQPVFTFIKKPITCVGKIAVTRNRKFTGSQSAVSAVIHLFHFLLLLYTDAG